MDKDYSDYKKVLQRGVNERKNIENAISKIAEKGVENVFLVGCGGSLAVMSPCKYILETNSRLPVYEYNAGEFISIKPKTFSEKSLVILSSYTGTTSETVAAAKFAKEVGAATVGFAGKADSELGLNVDYVFANDAKGGVTDSKLIMIYQIVFSLMKHVDNFEKYEEVMDAIARLPENLVQIKHLVEERAIKFANDFKDADFIMTIGSGILWGETYSYAVCILEEMQWIKAHPVHAGEFFHGSFEIVTEDSKLLIFKGEDLTRPLLDRVTDFTSIYNKNAEIIDTKDYPLEGVSEDIRGYMSAFVISTILERYSAKLAEVRNHPLSTRRYMSKVSY